MRASRGSCEKSTAWLVCQIEHFDETDTGAVVYATDDRGVITRGQRDDQSALKRMRWRHTAVYDFVPLAVLPIVVLTDEIAGTVAEFYHRIGKSSAHGTERRSKRADDNVFACAAGHDQAADEGFFADTD